MRLVDGGVLRGQEMLAYCKGRLPGTDDKGILALTEHHLVAMTDTEGQVEPDGLNSAWRVRLDDIKDYHMTHEGDYC